MRKRAMNYDVWFKKFKPVKNHIDSNASFDGEMFETYGKEFEHVRKQNPHNVWTLIEADEGKDEYIATGFHHVNRMGYFITEIPWTNKDEQECLQAKA